MSDQWRTSVSYADCESVQDVVLARVSVKKGSEMCVGYHQAMAAIPNKHVPP